MLVWKIQTLNINVASLRYRCLFPLRYLAKHGIQSKLYSGTDTVKLTPQTSAIIFVKSFHHVDVKTCDRAYEQGIPIILDLCDNIFIDGYGADSDHSPAQNFQMMAKKAAAIVTTGDAMKAEVEALLCKHPMTQTPLVTVIPDGNESIDDIKFAFQFTKQQRTIRQTLRPFKVLSRLYKQSRRKAKVAFYGAKGHVGKVLRRYGLLSPLPAQPIPAVETAHPHTDKRKKAHKKHRNQPAPFWPKPWPSAPGLKTVLWFGNHGAKYGNFGMLNILEAAIALESVSQDCPLRLMVISNNRQKYEAHIASLPIKTTYLPWHPRKIYDYIQASDVVIVPNSQSRYSICKSANRAVLALSQGTPVVASRTPALERLAGGVWLDDWEEGLRTYLLNPDIAEAHVMQAQEAIEATLSGEAIAQKWITLLNQVSASMPAHLSTSRSSASRSSASRADERTTA